MGRHSTTQEKLKYFSGLPVGTFVHTGGFTESQNPNLDVGVRNVVAVALKKLGYDALIGSHGFSGAYHGDDAVEYDLYPLMTSPIIQNPKEAEQVAIKLAAAVGPQLEEEYPASGWTFQSIY